MNISKSQAVGDLGLGVRVEDGVEVGIEVVVWARN